MRVFSYDCPFVSICYFLFVISSVIIILLLPLLFLFVRFSLRALRMLLLTYPRSRLDLLRSDTGLSLVQCTDNPTVDVHQRLAHCTTTIKLVPHSQSNFHWAQRQSGRIARPSPQAVHVHTFSFCRRCLHCATGTC